MSPPPRRSPAVEQKPDCSNARLRLITICLSKRYRSSAVTSVTHIERYRRTTNERISTNDIEHIERYRRMNTTGSKCLTGSMCLKNRRLLRRGSMVLSRAFPAFSRPKYYFLDLLRTSTNTFWVFVLCDTKTRTYDTLDDIDLTTKGLCNRF